MSSLHLDKDDRKALHGAHGRARQLAMEMVAEMAEALDAPRLIDIESAHIDGCLAFGQVALDLPERLLADGGRARVPTTLNVASLDLLHLERSTNYPDTAALGRKIVSAYEALECQPTWTCAPYQLPERPTLGTHIAWADPTPSSLPTPCLAPARAGTATSSTSAPRLPGGSSKPGCT